MNTKFSKFFAGALLMGLWACSSEEPAAIPTGGDHKAYLAVDIRDANSNTRATSSDFEDGKDFENKVSSDLFVFFDAGGHYMCTGNIKSVDWGGPGSDNESGSVEQIGRNVVVMSGLNGIDYPRYMLTILNDPAGLKEDIENNRYSMTQVQQLLPAYVPSAETGFMMTTSSHGGNDSMVTDLANYTIYSKEPSAAEVDGNYVKVYVERLAAGIDMKIGYSKTELKGKFHMGEMGSDGEIEYSEKTLYVKIEGWGLNSTARQSYLSKDINGLNNNSDIAGWTWDNGDFHRSYWGKSLYYGKDLLSNYTYLGGDEIATPYDEDVHTLQYFNWAQLSNQFAADGVDVKDSRGYCLENTNTLGKIARNNKLISKNVTCAIVKATLVDVNDNPVNAIRYQGILFERSSFIPYALSIVDGAGRLPYYVINEEKTAAATDGKTHYDQLGADSFELRLTGEGTGVVSVYSNIPEGTVVYKLSKVNNNESYTEMTDLSEIDQNLRAVIGTAMAYTNGAMFYVVPIRHLRDKEEGKVLEGNYGVVRNHLYSVTVGDIKTIGHGVFEPGTGSSSSSTPDPGEPIIPDDPDPEFYVSARINILAWRVVSQTIDF